MCYSVFCGPLLTRVSAGIIIGPLMGQISDRCTHPLGRRRPILIGFAVCTVLSFLLFSNSHAVGTAVGSERLSQLLCVMGFAGMDVCLNGIQSPARALLVDVAPASQTKDGNVLFGVMVGVGMTSGYLLGATNALLSL